MDQTTITEPGVQNHSGARLSYKFQRLREAIRQAINSGELEHKLPGEHELARRFGVNAKTISKALTDLTSEGLLVRQVGRGTFVAGIKHATESIVGVGRRYAYLSSHGIDRTFSETMYEMARNRLKSYGHDLEHALVSCDQRGELGERCLPISQIKDLAGILIHSSPASAALLADLARRHVPVVLCNTSSPLVKANCVTADYARGGYELTEHMALLGHLRIQLVLDANMSRASAEFQRGYQTALGRYGLEPVLAMRAKTSDVEDILDMRPAPSAFVCLGSQLAIGLKTGLDRTASQSKIRSSLAAMAEPGLLHLQQTLITSYDVYPDQVLDWAIQLLFDAGPGSVRREVIVPGVFNDRGSTSGIPTNAVPKPTEQVVI